MIDIFTEFISEWLKEIVLLFIIISLIDIVMPKGKMKRYVDFIIGILIIFTIISPFTNLNGIALNLDQEVSNFTDRELTVESMEQVRDDQIKEIYLNNLNKTLSKLIEENSEYNVSAIDIKTIPDKENIFSIEGLDILLSKEKKKLSSDIRVEKIEIGNSTKEVVSLEDDTEITDLIMSIIQIDTERINISYEDKEDKNGGTN